MLALIIATAAQLTAAPPAASPRGDLTVVVEGVQSATGLLHVDVCTQAAFLTDHCQVSRAVPAQGGSVVVMLPDVPPGEYAIQAWHDRNGDGEVNRNALGIPTEAFGFSRAPPMGLHGPSFARSAFAHGGEPQPVVVKLRRLF